LCVTCDRERPDYDNVNNHEADKIIQELDEFRKWAKNNPNPENTDWSLTILTFYRAQEHELSRRLRKYFGSSNFRTFTDKKHHLKVEVCTVDRFQGHESDVVFLSFVRNGFRVGFLNSMHRLNVSLTRARYQLVIFGNRKSFIKAYKKRHHSELLHALAKETQSDIRWSG
jgi:superfamily I DNA and/or RNA helicase